MHGLVKCVIEQIKKQLGLQNAATWRNEFTMSTYERPQMKVVPVTPKKKRRCAFHRCHILLTYSRTSEEGGENGEYGEDDTSEATIFVHDIAEGMGENENVLPRHISLRNLREQAEVYFSLDGRDFYFRGAIKRAHALGLDDLNSPKAALDQDELVLKDFTTDQALHSLLVSQHGIHGHNKVGGELEVVEGKEHALDVFVVSRC
jgi:hypothetical protein